VQKPAISLSSSDSENPKAKIDPPEKIATGVSLGSVLLTTSAADLVRWASAFLKPPRITVYHYLPTSGLANPLPISTTITDLPVFRD
jgi:hypothetical protein